MASELSKLNQTLRDGLEKADFDLTLDYAQLTLEAIMNNEVLKEIPVVKTLVGITRGALAVREFFIAKKLIAFLQQFHLGEIPDEERQKFISELEADSKLRDRTIEQIVIMNDRYINVEKSTIHANLLLAHIHNKLSWEEYGDLLVSLDALHPRSLYHLDEIGQSFQTKDTDVAFEAALLSSGLATQRVSCYVISDLGRKLYYYGLKADFDAAIPPVLGYDKRSEAQKESAKRFLTR